MAALLWYEPLLNSFWGSLAGIFIFGILVSLTVAWFLTKLSKKSGVGDWQWAGRVTMALAVGFFIFYAGFSIHKQENFITGYD